MMRSKIINVLGASFWVAVVIGVCNILPKTYEKKDVSGTPINCEKMLDDSRSGNGFSTNFPYMFASKSYLYDREQDNGYVFTQCRDEIELEHLQRCKDFIRKDFETTTVSYWSDYSNMKNDRVRCKAEVSEYVLAFDDPYEIDGNALLVNGYVFPKVTLTLKPLDTWYGGNAPYFVVKLTNGSESTYLRYGKESRAKEVYEEISNVIAH